MVPIPSTDNLWIVSRVELWGPWAQWQNHGSLICLHQPVAAASWIHSNPTFPQVFAEYLLVGLSQVNQRGERRERRKREKKQRQNESGKRQKREGDQRNSENGWHHWSAVVSWLERRAMWWSWALIIFQWKISTVHPQVFSEVIPWNKDGNIEEFCTAKHQAKHRPFSVDMQILPIGCSHLENTMLGLVPFWKLWRVHLQFSRTTIHKEW